MPHTLGIYQADLRLHGYNRKPYISIFCSSALPFNQFTLKNSRSILHAGQTLRYLFPKFMAGLNALFIGHILYLQAGIDDFEFHCF